MSLLRALNLPAIPGARNAARAEAHARPAPPSQSAPADLAPLDQAIGEAVQVWKELAADGNKEQLAQAVAAAKAQREAAAKMADATARAEQVKKATDALKEKSAPAINALRGLVGMKPMEKPKEEAKDGTFKPKFNAITDKGKIGAGGGAEAELEVKKASGTTYTCTASFEGKAWVETKPVDAYDPLGEMEVSFHLVLGGKGWVGAKKKAEGDGTSGGVNAGASVELELTKKRVLKAEETKAYVASVQNAQGGGWDELRALKLAATASYTDARALMMRLGGKPRGAPQEGDEDEQKLTGTLEGGADLSARKGAFGIAIGVGVSTSGVLTRKVAFKDKCYWITLNATQSTSSKGAVGGSFEGVGMGVNKTRDQNESRAVTFVIDPAKPDLKPLLEKVLAATTVAQMLELRAKNPGVASFDVKTTGSGEGDGVNASLFGVGIAGANRSFGSTTEIDGPDGRTVIHEGGNTTGANAIIGDKPIGGSTRTDRFSGGAGADNQGFGESSSTDRSGDLVGGVKALVDKAKKSPLSTANDIATGKAEYSKEVVHVEGAAFTDESYGQLAARAAQGDAKWIKYWRGSMNTLADWRAARGAIVKAGKDRQKIAQVIADFEKGSGRGRHETVRNAISGTEVAFELPPEMAGKKSYFDSLVVNDPLPAALGAGAPAEVVKKLEAIERQLTGFRNDMSKIQGDFRQLADFQDMAERLDLRRVAVDAALRKARADAKAADDAAKGVNQFSVNPPMVSSPDSPEERERIDKLRKQIERLKQNIGDAYQQEQAHFSAWEQNLKGDKALGFIPTGVDEKKLIAHENQLRALYPRWDKMRIELRQALTEAGKPYDPGEADAVQPDRKRYRELRARDPQAGWQRPDGV